MTNLTIIHTGGTSLEVRAEDMCLLRYVYASAVPALESPRPYFHPLRTLAGNEVSLFRPYDHLWHAGLSMTMAQLSGENFWGGPTYTRSAQAYEQLANNGRIQHQSWTEIQTGESFAATEQLQWITQAGSLWLEEERRLTLAELRPEAGYWSLDLAFHLTNVHSETLIFGSPTTEGRPQAGYGGLFWRGPRSFLHGQILAADGLEGPGVMGQSSPWLAFSGWHDGTARQSTLLFIDRPGNPRYPNRWFVRNDPYACVSHAFMFDEYYHLAPGSALDLSYRLVIADGCWSRAQIESYHQDL